MTQFLRAGRPAYLANRLPVTDGSQWSHIRIPNVSARIAGGLCEEILIGRRRVMAGSVPARFQPGAGLIRSSGPRRPGSWWTSGPDPPRGPRDLRRGAGRGRARRRDMHRAKGPGVPGSGGLLPDVSEAAPAPPGALSRGC